MASSFNRVVLTLLYDLDASGGEADPDQLLHWMTMLADAIGELDPTERAAFVATAREMAADAQANGEPDRAVAYARVADAEDSGV